MTEKQKKIVEIAVLGGGAAILLIALLWWESKQTAPIATSVTAPGGGALSTVGGQPINLSFQSAPINLTLAGSYEAGYVPLFGFLGYGPYF